MLVASHSLFCPILRFISLYHSSLFCGKAGYFTLYAQFTDRSSLDHEDRGRNSTGSSISDLFWGESKYTSVWALPWKKERKDELNLCSHFIWAPQTACAEVCPTEHPVHGMWLMVLGEKKLPWTNKFWKYFLSTLLVYWNSQSLQYTFKCTMSLQE